MTLIVAAITAIVVLLIIAAIFCVFSAKWSRNEDRDTKMMMNLSMEIQGGSDQAMQKQIEIQNTPKPENIDINMIDSEIPDVPDVPVSPVGPVTPNSEGQEKLKAYKRPGRVSPETALSEIIAEFDTDGPQETDRGMDRTWT